MTETIRSRALFNIITGSGACRACSALLLVLGACSGAAGQTLDSAIDDAVSSQIDQQVEDAVTGVVEQQVEDAVTGTVEQQVESGIVRTVEQQVESGVVGTVEQQIESGVVESVQQTLEDGVVGTIEQTLDRAAGDALTRIDDAARDAGEFAGQAGDTPGGSEAEDDGQNDAGFATELDPGGRTTERDVWVILVPAEHRARIQDWGFDVREQLDLDSLERVLLRIDAPEDRNIAQAALDLAVDAPGTRVDFNHVYRPETDEPRQPLRVGRANGDAGRAQAAAQPTIGLVDTLVDTAHPVFATADIRQRDFVRFAAARPKSHGTAIASLLVGSSAQLHGRAVGARLRSGNVFFEDAPGRSAATAAGLVGALDWLAAEGADVVNMSLAGPPNSVLEAAIDQILARDIVVVAAVGNNGPAGEPLYPAAYAGVLSVTAVDTEHRVYAYAGRGPHVSFAAPGVDVTAAHPDGGYRSESGTSIAAAHATAIVARALAGRGERSAHDMIETLKAAAIDLGERDFDEIFGFGLIADPAVVSLTSSP